MGVAITYKGNTIASMADSGSKTLKTAGKYCEADIGISYTASAAVPCKSFTATVAADQTAKTYLTSADSDIVSHMSDSNFWVAVIPLFGYSSGLSFRGGFDTTRNLHDGASDAVYGILYRTTSSGASSSTWISKAATASGADIGVDSTGKIFVYASSTIVLRAGAYMCVCGW